MRRAIVIWTLFLCGCSGSLLSISGMSPAQLRAVDDDTIIQTYSWERMGNGENANLRTEIVRRGLLSPDELRRLDSRTIRIGDTETFALACWGQPEHVNTYRDGPATTRQMVYGRVGDAEQNVVYVTNGKVTSLDTFGGR